MTNGYEIARRIFMDWLNDNSDSFPGIEIRKAHNTFRFKEMHPDMEFLVGFIDICAIFYHEKEFWDGVLVADLPEVEKENDRFFCKECFSQSGKKEVYDSIENLLEEHTIKSLKKWIKRNLRKDKRMLFFNSAGATWVEVCAVNEVREKIDRSKEKDNGLEMSVNVKPIVIKE